MSSFRDGGFDRTEIVLRLLTAKTAKKRIILPAWDFTDALASY
jgi:hypothetical protein